MRALEERGLCARGESTNERYRFAWIPTFHPSVVVRAEHDGRSSRLIARILSGAGGYDPGTVVRDTVVSLQSTEWVELQAAIEKSSFWAAPQVPPDSLLGLDGSRWILEGYREGRYHVVDRWSPERNGPDAAHRAVGEWLLRKTGLVSMDLVRSY
jgi:hypothetical protein